VEKEKGDRGTEHTGEKRNGIGFAGKGEKKRRVVCNRRVKKKRPKKECKRIEH